MMLIIGLFIIPISLLIISKIKNYKTSYKLKNLLYILLFVISMLFILVTFFINKEPFQFEIRSTDDYLIYGLIIFIFTPFLWIHFFEHIGIFFSKLRVKKNSKIKTKNLYKYFRDDLNKLSPGLLMFIRDFEINTKKAISATILKLKLTGNIKESKNDFKVVNEDNLIKSEKMVLDLIQKNSFDERLFKETIQEESISNHYVKKSFKSKFLKIPLILIYIIIPVLAIVSSIKFDNYVFSKYKFYLKDGERYLLVADDIGDIHFDNPKNIDDYYHGYIKEEKRTFYDKSLINTNKTNYKMVRESLMYHSLDLALFLTSFLITFIFIYKIIQELMFINKSYIRTSKGTDVLNKSFALKNFLNDFSDIKNKKEEELILWEYYLVYATILGVNVQITDKLINKYIK